MKYCLLLFMIVGVSCYRTIDIMTKFMQKWETIGSPAQLRNCEDVVTVRAARSNVQICLREAYVPYHTADTAEKMINGTCKMLPGVQRCLLNYLDALSLKCLTPGQNQLTRTALQELSDTTTKELHAYCFLGRILSVNRETSCVTNEDQIVEMTTCYMGGADALLPILESSQSDKETCDRLEEKSNCVTKNLNSCQSPAMTTLLEEFATLLDTHPCKQLNQLQLV